MRLIADHSSQSQIDLGKAKKLLVAAVVYNIFAQQTGCQMTQLVWQHWQRPKQMCAAISSCYLAHTSSWVHNKISSLCEWCQLLVTESVSSCYLASEFVLCSISWCDSAVAAAPVMLAVWLSAEMAAWCGRKQDMAWPLYFLPAASLQQDSWNTPMSWKRPAELHGHLHRHNRPAQQALQLYTHAAAALAYDDVSACVLVMYRKHSAQIIWHAEPSCCLKGPSR